MATSPPFGAITNPNIVAPAQMPNNGQSAVMRGVNASGGWGNALGSLVQLPGQWIKDLGASKQASNAQSAVSGGSYQNASGGYSTAPFIPNPKPDPYVLNGITYDAAGNPISGSATTGNPTVPQSPSSAASSAPAIASLPYASLGTTYGAGAGGGGAPPGYQYKPAPNGGMTLQPIVKAEAPEVASGVGTSQPASSGTSPTTFDDLMASIAENNQQYGENSQTSAAENAAEQNYLQALNYAQNLQLNVKAQQLGQNYTGGLASAASANAGQIAFRNQLGVLGATNAANLAQQNLGYLQQQQQLGITAGQNVMENYLNLLGVGKTTLSPGETLSVGGQTVATGAPMQAPSASDVNSLASIYLQYGYTTDPAQAYQMALTALQGASSAANGTPSSSPLTISSVTGYNNNGTAAGNAPVVSTPGTVNGYNLASYNSTDANYSSEVQSAISGMPSSMTYGPQGFQSYISSVSPNSPITGQDVYNASSTAGVDARVLMGVMQHESSMGTSKVAQGNNNPGGLKFANQVGAVKGGAASDGGYYAKFDTMADGVQAVANQLALDYTPPSSGVQYGAGQGTDATTKQVQTYAQLKSEIPPVYSGALGVLSDGIPYLQASKIPSTISSGAAQAWAAQNGVPYLNDDQLAKVQQMDVVTQKISQMIPLLTSTLSSGVGGRIEDIAKNFTNNWLQNNQGMIQLNSLGNIAINAIVALNGGEGSGVRVTQADIDNAQTLVPLSSDSLDTAQTKIASLQQQLNEWSNEYLQGTNMPTNFAQIQKDQGSGASSSDAVDSYLSSLETNGNS